jgi:hypothetical protein
VKEKVTCGGGGGEGVADRPRGGGAFCMGCLCK